jgi:hypothetical protein
MGYHFIQQQVKIVEVGKLTLKHFSKSMLHEQ